MSYVIGFDLGTHQTKICVQDASNPAEKTYRFFEFDTPDGNSTVLFPSLVQINKDHTVSYGYCNENDVLYVGGTTEPRPLLNLLPEVPEPSYPPHIKPNYPPKPKFDPWNDSLRKLKGEKTEQDKWKELCKILDDKADEAWKLECTNIRKKYDEEVLKRQEENLQIRDVHEQKLKEWEEASKSVVYQFRYFKLHALTGRGLWTNNDINSTDICVWYIGYILLLLRQRYGDDMVVQFGVPCGAANTNEDKGIIFKAYKIFIAAADLIDNFESVEDYLLAKYEDLVTLTKYKRIDSETINNYYFDDIPEAFAGLVAVTLQKKLGTGFHLLVDIGGGTTDIALFCIQFDTNIPDVLMVRSFPYGINHILEMAQKNSNKLMYALQKEFLSNPKTSIFREPINGYKRNLKGEGRYVLSCIVKAFRNSYSHHGRSISELNKALENQPIIFGGGGGSFSTFHIPIESFTDIRKIDKSMLSIRNLLTPIKDDKVYTILATSYGLASYEKDYDKGIECTDISVAFQKFLPQRKGKESHCGMSYEHGMTDD